jgi:hypothetical protein
VEPETLSSAGSAPPYAGRNQHIPEKGFGQRFHGQEQNAHVVHMLPGALCLASCSINPEDTTEDPFEFLKPSLKRKHFPFHLGDVRSHPFKDVYEVSLNQWLSNVI